MMVHKEPPVKEADQIIEKENAELSFEEAYSKLYPGIVRFFERRRFSQEVARELAQDVFVRVYKNWDSFRASASRKTWIWRIAENLLRNELRRLSAQMRSGDEDPLPDDDRAEPSQLPEALDRLLERERKLLLREAIDELPSRMRQCALLRWKGSPIDKIAASLDVSKNTVKSQLFDARRKLREKLTEHFPELLERLKEGDETDE